MRGRVLAAGVALVGCLVAVFGIVDALKVLEVSRWPTTAGVVTSSTIGRHSEQVRRNNTTRERSFSWPEVTYTYEVNGAPFTGSEVSPFSPKKPRLLDRVFSNSYPRAEALANKYRADQQVTVHYDPASPSRAFLEAPLSFGMVLGLLMALVIPVAGVVFLRRS